MTGYPALPEIEPDGKNHLRRIVRRLNDINAGKFDCTMSVTLTANATSTTLTDARIYATSFIGFMAETANAATALAAVYVTDRIKGSCVVNHASSANTDQDFTVLVLG